MALSATGTNNKLLILGGRGGVNIYDREKGNIVKEISIEGRGVANIISNPKNKCTLFTSNNKIYQYDIDKDNLKVIYEYLNNNMDYIKDIDVSKDGNELVPVAESPFCHPERSEGSQKGRILRFAQNDNWPMALSATGTN
jgi:hypothetical protein